ncbi:MAG: DNA recombination protein RmuC [Proteobacteria bacterium]|nr:DNA recombination protein RmuC [Pseudomonadota bacterium]
MGYTDLMNSWFDNPQVMIGIVMLVMILCALVLVLVLRFPKQIKSTLENLSLAHFRENSEMLNALADRLLRNQSALNENLRSFLSNEFNQLRSSSGSFQIKLIEEQSIGKEKTLATISEMRNDVQSKLDLIRSEVIARILEKLSEQSRAEREVIQSTLKAASTQLQESMEQLGKVTDNRLEQISGKVNERLEEGFKKTNQTFVSVMERLATIDEAQKKIDGLTTNVIGLQELLGDRSARGAFGEVQLENLVRNMLAPSAYDFQHTYSNGKVVDCVLKLPDPTGNVSVDSKFPLENYHRMFGRDVSSVDRGLAQKAFRIDIKKHVDSISDKYIIDGETSDGAVMFIPAESVFAEIHAYHREVVEYAMQKKVWIVSPTTLMAVLNTARAVMKDIATREQIHIIKHELRGLSHDFNRFDDRMRKLADHIRQAHKDAEDVRVSSDKITKRFNRIEKVELTNTIAQDYEIKPEASIDPVVFPRTASVDMDD